MQQIANNQKVQLAIDKEGVFNYEKDELDLYKFNAHKKGDYIKMIKRERTRRLNI